MEPIRVVKNGKSTRNCIKIPDAYLDKELEITIRPIPVKKDYGRSISALFSKYPDVRPFAEISDPNRWEREIEAIRNMLLAKHERNGMPPAMG